MPPPDSAAVDAALVAVLEGDAVLQALCPGGVFFMTAPQDADHALVFALADHQVEWMFGGVAWEDFTYAIAAIMPATDNAQAMQAASRVRALLDDEAGAVLAPVGWSVMTSQYRRYGRDVEVDPQNFDARYQHRGGQYFIRVQPSP